MSVIDGAPTETKSCGERECVSPVAKRSTCAMRCSAPVDIDYTFKLMSKETAESMWFLMCSEQCYSNMKNVILGTPEAILVQACGRCGKSQANPSPENRYQAHEGNVLLCKECSAITKK